MTNDKAIEFELATPDGDHVATMQVPVTDALRTAVHEQMQVMALGRQSEARFSWDDYAPAVDDGDAPRMDGVEFGLMGSPEGNNLGFFLTGFEKHVGTELRSSPVNRIDAPGLDDLTVDAGRVNAARRVLGLESQHLTLVQWTDSVQDDAGGVIALNTDPSDAWDFINELPEMSSELREQHDLPATDFEIQGVHRAEDYFAELLSGSITVDTDAVRTAAREENENAPGGPV